MNVCEEAIRSQRDNRVYGKPDRWTQIHLNGGDKIYQVTWVPYMINPAIFR